MNDRPFLSEKLLIRQSSAAEAQLSPLAPVPTQQQGRPAMTRLASVGQGGRLPSRPSAPNGVPSPVGGGGGSGSTDTTTPSVMAALLNHPNLISPLSSSSGTTSNPRKRKLPPDDTAFSKVIDYQTSELKRLKTAYVDKMALAFYLKNNNHLTEFNEWRSKPPSNQLLHFFKTQKLNVEDTFEDLGGVYQSSLPAPGTTTTLPAVQKLAEVREIILPSSLPTPRVQLTPLKSHTITAALKSYAASPASTPHQPLQKEENIPSQGDGNNRGAINQEQIVERAKQEAYVIQRIGELQKDGLWAERRLPKIHELPRAKAHWDYLLEEMAWLAADFAQERKWKKAAAKKCARMVQKYFQDKEAMAQKAIRAQELQLKKIASFMAREVKQFWANVEKLVEFKQQIRLEEKRKKALDQHLSFIVDQTEKYSSLVAESMNTSSLVPEVDCHKHSDVEFEPDGCSDDDEETIAKEEALSAAEKDKVSEEIEALQREGELPLEDLLPDYLEKRDSLIVSSPSESSIEDDDEFKAPDKESDDDEETINEEEKVAKGEDNQNELDELKALGEMDIEELKAKYNVGQTLKPESVKNAEEICVVDSDDDSSDGEEQDEDDVDVENSESEEEEEVNENESTLDEESSALKSLLVGDENDADKEMNDVAAIAESLQPKGNTLSSTKVVTKVPFLLKHSLREYQHIGLDWLVTMYERKLNGILADEMGLGKTIQTIALLAHLACEKENWGPHLIVVPTSVMLNWEMEFKKWCPAFKILTYFGSQKERKLKRSGWTKPNAFHVCITSYKLVIQDHQSFRRKKWKYLILDEAQNIKNFKSQRWQLLLNFQTQRRLLLTGTPLQNNLMELWSLMHFLMPYVFESHREFKEWFSNPVTGMIEGNAEYNENIIKRLHKVLRPFLLRRLKSEVETQMPKKYEHVVMCRLSNRQRYLYDDFMSRTKTRETLASGNYLSVINVLMQLRKVCNHPNLFEVRPTVSPFQMEGLTCRVPSRVFNALDYNPFRHTDWSSLNLSFVDNEFSISAYSAIRAKQLKTRRATILNIDAASLPPPQCPKTRVSISFKERSTLPPLAQKLQQFSSSPQGRAVAQQTATNNHKLIHLAAKVGTSPVVKTVVSGQNQGQGVVFRLANNPNSSAPNYVQLLHQPGGGVKAISLSPTQVVKSDGTTMTRVLPPFAQVLNTPSGRQLVLSGQQVIASQAGGTTLTTSTGQRLTVVSKPGTNVAKLVGPGIAQMSTVRPIVRVPSITIGNSVVSMQNCLTTSVSTSVVNTASPTKVSSPVFVTNVVASPTSSPTKIPISSKLPLSPAVEKPASPKTVESPLFDKELADKIKTERSIKLSVAARINERRCDRYPMLGEDLTKSVSVTKHSPSKLSWRCAGHVHCERSSLRLRPKPDVYWSETEALKQAIYSVEDRVAQLGDLFQRFILYVPAVAAPTIDLRVPHPPPWKVAQDKRREEMLFAKVKTKSRLLHQIVSAMATQFPDPRLIQYDCGKLQSLDRLLRDLKQNHHRVLIFTQMTKMLDVLESFLNFHGHIYLRLDGTTRVDQRQVLMERFNADKRIFCFILSTRSGGVGVNLTGADTVIFYDSDWNPTMDAQAQDRCHRIGQTRDVHIYRLISDKTIEENILKKANQKRMLGDLAIEGGNFTTAYFKKSTIQDLFNVDQSESEASRRLADILDKEPDAIKTDSGVLEETQQDAEKAALGALESALAEAEDDTDVAAARVVRAEAAAELAEFDENIPLDAPQEPEMSKAEMELNALMQQLNGVEKYAMKFMEEIEPAFSAEQLAAVEAEIESQKREWELAMLRDEQKKLNRSRGVNCYGGSDSESDEVITFSGSDARNQYWISDDGKETMPIWCPPTPPQEGSDVYIDRALDYLYQRNVMSESQLPPVHVKKEKKRTRIEAGLPEGRLPLKVKPREETLIHSAPRSLFDRPSPAVIKMRQELRLQRYRGVMRPTSIQHILKSPIPPNLTPAQEPDHVLDWIIQEDWAILQAIQQIQELPLSVIVLSPGQTPNWDFVADFVNHTSRTYRSAKQCRNRYESVIMPREEGKLILDNPKKQKKTKTVYKLPQVKSGRPMRTSQLYVQDNNTTITQIMNTRFEAIRAVSNKRTPTVKPLLVDPAMKNPKHAEVLAECNIDYDKPLTPVQVAAKRADRIAKEKLLSVQVKNSAVTEQQLAALRQQQLQQQLAAQQLAAVAAAAQQQQSSQQQVQPTTLKMASITVPTVVSNVMTVPSATATRAVTVQVRSGGEIIATPGATRTIITSSPSSSPSSTAQQRPVTGNVVAVQSPITAATGKGTKISAAQLQLLRQQHQNQMLRQQQQLRVLHARPPGQKVPVAVSASTGSPQRVQQVKTNVTTRAVTEPEMMALLKRQQAAKVPVTAATLTSAQLLAPASLQASTSGTISQVATLVKTVPATSVPIAGLALPQVRMKAALASGIKTSTVTPQQIRQLSLQQQQQLLAQQRKLPQQKVTQLSQVATKSGTTQLIVQSPKSLPATMTMQQIQQVMKHVQPQQVITAQGTTAQVLSPHVFKNQAGSPQARVIPVVSTSQQPIKQAIQVVASTSAPGTPVTTRTVQPSVTLDASGRTPTTALAGTIKAGTASQAALLTQVSAVLQQQGQPITVRQPVRLQTTSTAPLVAVSMAAVTQTPTVLTLPPQPPSDNNLQPQ